MLSKKTKYGLKALAVLATFEVHKPVQIRLIADRANVSVKFLESILLSLKKAGFLGSKKGQGGGYYLMKEPDTVALTDVIRVLEGPIAMLPCVSLNYYEPCADCESEEACGVHRLLLKVRDNTLDVFGNHSIADLK